jgi:hypothetical protein
MSASMKPRRPRKPTQLQQGILCAAADLARYIYDIGDAAALLKRPGLADGDYSAIDEKRPGPARSVWIAASHGVYRSGPKQSRWR